MACDITSGFELGCRDNVGGIKNIYILSGDITDISEDSDEKITDIDGTGTFYKFELPRNVGDFTEAPSPSLENGTVFYTQTINAAFHKMQSKIRNQVKVLAQNPDLKIVVEMENGVADNVGRFFLIGRYRGAVLTGGAGTSGAAFGDANQYALTFEATEPTPAFEITTTGELASALTTITVG